MVSDKENEQFYVSLSYYYLLLKFSTRNLQIKPFTSIIKTLPYKYKTAYDGQQQSDRLFEILIVVFV